MAKTKTKNKTWKVIEWQGCYPSAWKGHVVADAMQHPAKYSSRLIKRIYEHMTAEGWLQPGDHVVDPFGGVALGGLDAMRLGLHWTGVELEPRFWKIGQENIKLWNARFGSMPRWGIAQLLNGDSRKLLQVIKDQAAAISSPPYAETTITERRNISGDASLLNEEAGRAYGETPGQLGSMGVGGFEAAISSPPFLQSEGGTPEPKPGGAIDAALYARHAAGNAKAHGYGKTEGQLSSMDGDGFEAAISSPPYENIQENAKSINREKQYVAYKKSGGGQTFEQFCRTQDIHSQGYGSSDGQLSMEAGDNFWMAAREIVEQVYAGLKPGGHACWVVKDYVKNKQVVPFCDQWRQLCEAVGFETLHEHRAMLVHRKGKQGTLEGGHVEIKTESKSFFRRMAEKKGSPRIDWEVVWCMRKP